MKFKQRLQIAGRELIKGNLGNVVKSFTISASSYRSNGGLYFFDDSGTAHHFTYENLNSSLKAYVRCAPITAIINSKAQAYINGKTFILNTQGKAKGKEATGEIATRVRDLLKKPNPFNPGGTSKHRIISINRYLDTVWCFPSNRWDFPTPRQSGCGMFRLPCLTS
jgi:hypothetical protein